MREKIAQINEKYKFWGVMLLSALVRVLRISSRPIWYDEAIAILRAEKGLGPIIQGTLGSNGTGGVPDIHPPGYFLTIYGWMEIFGNSILATRLLSVLLGLLTIWVVYKLGKVTLGREAALLGALFVGFSPFNVHYSQEIRMYSMMAFTLSLATYALFRGMKDDRWVWWALFAGASAAAQYTQQLSAVYLVCLAAIPIFRRDFKATLKTLIAGVGAIILYLPWLVNLMDQVASLDVYWIEKPTISRFLTLLLAYVAGLPVQGIWLPIGFALTVLLLVFSTISMVRIIKERETDKSGMWFAYLAFAPPLLLWLVSQYRPVYIERALLSSAVMFVVWVAWLIAHKRTPRVEKFLMTSFVLIASVIGITSHLTYEGFSYARYEEIGRTIENQRLEDEVIVHSNKLTFVPMYYYFRDDIPQRFVADIEGSGVDTLHPVTQQVLGFQESKDLISALGNAEGVWFLIFQRAIDEAREMGFDNHPHLEWLDDNFDLVSKELWVDLWVYHYRNLKE